MRLIQRLNDHYRLNKMVTNQIAIFLLMLFSPKINAAEINFKTNVIKGSCKFLASSVNKNIVFSKLYTIGDFRAVAVNSPVDTMKFDLGYSCEDFDKTNNDPINFNVKLGANSQYSNSVFYGATDKTNTGFIIRYCKDTTHCNNLEPDKNIDIYNFNNGDNQTVFWVDLVKRSEAVAIGTTTASVIFEIIQN